MNRKIGIRYRECPYCHCLYNAEKKHACYPKREHYRKQHERYAKREKAVTRPLKTKRWYHLRKKIITADGGYCQRCWLKYGVKTYQNLEVHHIKPRIKYPALIFDPNNLICLCHTCNAQLGLNGIDFNWSPKDRKFKNIHYGYVL